MIFTIASTKTEPTTVLKRQNKNDCFISMYLRLNLVLHVFKDGFNGAVVVFGMQCKANDCVQNTVLCKVAVVPLVVHLVLLLLL